jgi:hypothetical protein
VKSVALVLGVVALADLHELRAPMATSLHRYWATLAAEAKG